MKYDTVTGNEDDSLSEKFEDSALPPDEDEDEGEE